MGNQEVIQIFQGLGTAHDRGPSSDNSGGGKRGQAEDESCHEAREVLPLGEEAESEDRSFHSRGAAPDRREMQGKIPRVLWIHSLHGTDRDADRRGHRATVAGHRLQKQLHRRSTEYPAPQAG